MAAKVNLDAIIPREDFDVVDEQNSAVGRSKDTIAVNDLKRGEFLFSALRKPDFQRETNEWDADKVCDLIQSFLDGDLIPAVILWRYAGSYVFVIDGSHRLSALAAWINDDYGDGDISKQFYNGIIPDEQLGVAEATRTLVRKRIGPFKDYQLALTNPEKVRADIVVRAKSLGALAVQLQWVQGDSKKAEASFLKINQQASPIDATEIRVLKARRKPNGIAARAIVRSGRGHKYWSGFSDDCQARIEELSQEINDLLFEPRLDNPIKTLDLPIGGKRNAAQSLALILDFINIVNNVSGIEPLDDADGSLTLRFLMECKKVALRMNSSHPGSLGLHPIVYFYSELGRHKPASFYAVTALILQFEKEDSFIPFTEIRADFETLLLSYDYLIQQIVRKYRAALPSYPRIRDFFMECIDKLYAHRSKGEESDGLIARVIEEITREPKYEYLTHADHDVAATGKDFSTETKSAAFIREALGGAPHCGICGGYIHRNSIQIDHIVRRADGGLGTLDNAQLAHPFCNSTYKG